MNSVEHLKHASGSHHNGNEYTLCSVCGDQADGYHYGVLSCRGCNAFFRRAITYNLQFTCRRGGNCIIDRNARCACRACRLNKCKLAGMDRSAVQIRSEFNKCNTINEMPILPQTISSTEIEESQTSCSLKSTSPNYATAAIGSPNSAFTPFTIVNNSNRLSTSLSNHISTTSTALLTTPITVLGSVIVLSSLGLQSSYLLNSSTSASTTDVSQQNLGFLDRMVDDYFDQRRRRRSMLCTSLEELLTDDFEYRLRGPASLNDLSAIYRVQMILMFEWVEKLDEFQLINNPHDKARLLRAFSMKYLVLDNIFHTLELNQIDRLVFVNNSFIQSGNLPEIFNQYFQEIVSLEIQHALALMYGESSLKIVEELIQPMVQMNITFGELMLLRLLIFWNPGTIGLSEETQEVISKASERALQELQNYFNEHKIGEWKSRLANILVLLQPLAKHTQLMNEITSLIPNFGEMPEWDSYMNDLLKK